MAAGFDFRHRLREERTYVVIADLIVQMELEREDARRLLNFA